MGIDLDNLERLTNERDAGIAMAENSKIEWCHHTFNPWIGCTKIGPGCDHCYAEADFDKRRHVVQWGAGKPRKRTAPSTWAQPVKWNAEAERLGIRYRVFCASLADVFDNEVSVQWRIDLMRLILDTPYLDWLLVTKRIGNAHAMLETAFRACHAGREGWADNVLSNVWIGATITNQAEADRDIPKLLDVPAAVRFLSMEPLLGPVALRHISFPEDDGSDFGGWSHCDAVSMWLDSLTGNVFSAERHGDELGGIEQSFRMTRLNWVIVGGESGPNARPMHPAWARSLRDQCAEAGVPFLFKQWGEWLPTEKRGNDVILRFPLDSASFGPAQPEFHEWEDGTGAAKVGKKAAGRLLDDVRHDGYPNIQCTRGGD